jgi:hypothetical protein
LNLRPNTGFHFLQLEAGAKNSSNFANFLLKLIKFRKNCRSYCIELCWQISKRFDSDDETFKNLDCIDPSVALSGLVRTLLPLMVPFPYLLGKADRKIEGKWDIVDVQRPELEFRKDFAINSPPFVF